MLPVEPASKRHPDSRGVRAGRWLQAVAIAGLLATSAVAAALIWTGLRDFRPETATNVRTATGRNQSWGPERRSANIAHDRIEGFMEAMTMSFEFTDAKQAAGLHEGQAVRFTFTTTRDGKLAITTIAPNGH